MSQSLSSVIVHAVFSTKHRNPTLRPEIWEELFPYLGGVLKNIKCPPIQVGGVSDHVHILYAQSRTLSTAKVVEVAKTSTSKWIKERWQDNREFSWQDGYGAFSIGIGEIEVVKRYILSQEEHHTTTSFQDELRKILERQRIDYDERYLWD